MNKARAKVFEKPNQNFKNVDFDIPVLKDGEVLVEINYATICASDLHTFNNRRTTPTPTILGHEIVGTIVDMKLAKAKDFSGEVLNIGDRITWSVFACDSRDIMTRKRDFLGSQALFKYGHHKISQTDSLSGGFASHCLIRKGTAIFKLEDTISNVEASPLNCTHATISAAFRLANTDFTDKNVLVVGVGMLGVSACSMARYVGAKNVWSIDINTKKMETSLKFGADQSFHSDQENLLEKFMELGGVDVVIETSGIPEAMEKALCYSVRGSIHIWVGAVFTQRDLQINAEKVIRNIVTIKGVHNYAPQDLEYAIKFMKWAKDKYPFSSLVAEEYNLESLEQAFEKASSSNCYRIGINM